MLRKCKRLFLSMRKNIITENKNISVIIYNRLCHEKERNCLNDKLIRLSAFTNSQSPYLTHIFFFFGCFMNCFVFYPNALYISLETSLFHFFLTNLELSRVASFSILCIMLESCHFSLSASGRT